MKVEVTVDQTTLTGENDTSIPSITMTCSRCDHEVQVYGQSIRSIKRGCVMFKEECPYGESNFYIYDKKWDDLG